MQGSTAMIFLSVLFLLQSPAAASSDTATASLVEAIRNARDRNERLVEAYQVTASQRLGVGIKAVARNRILFRQEVSAKISWYRDQPSRVEVTGARQGVPIAFQGDRIPEGLTRIAASLVVNPGEDQLRLSEQDTAGFWYPLRPGGENDYRFSIGDTTVIELPSGQKIRLVELVVVPKRSDWHLVVGSFWYDRDSYGLVRAAFRPARPYEFQRDADSASRQQVPEFVNPKAELKFVTLEYALQDSRWWMLRYVAAEAVGTVGAWLGVPIKFERIYDDYQVQGGSERDTGLRAPPAGSRGWVRDTAFRRRADSVRAERERCLEEARESADELPDRSARETRLRELSAACRDRAAWTDSMLTVIIPPDTLALITSPTLGDPILGVEDLLEREELRAVADLIDAIPPDPWGARLELPRGAGALARHLRFNRVEGLSLGVGGRADFNRLEARGLARIGLADGTPNLEVDLALPQRGYRLSVSGYRRLAVANPDAKPFGVVNSVEAFLFRRDEGEYFWTSGFDLMARGERFGGWTIRVYRERHLPVIARNRFSMPGLLGDDDDFRPNFTADTATQRGIAATLRVQRPLSHLVSTAADLSVEASSGDYRFRKWAAVGRAVVSPPQNLAVALEAAVGGSAGTVPIQSRYFLGGPGSLRGFTGGVMIGDAFWRGRIELGTSTPVARLALFTDLGWAGPRRDFDSGRALVGVGAGLSLLDGLLRLDLARGLGRLGGWRLDLRTDALL